MNSLDPDDSIEKWKQSADAWIVDQGNDGDWSRKAVLDPALDKILTDVKGKSVLDLGCGEGRYSRLLRSKLAHVTGLDPVSKFIDQARQLDTESSYVEGVAENLPFDNESFDIVLSYLSLIDIKDLASAAGEIARVTRVGGQLVVVTISNVASTTESWIKDDSGNKSYRKIDRYMEHFAMDLEWRNISIRNYHRPLSYVLEQFLARGFVMTRFVEPLPDQNDANFMDEYRVPTFQIFAFRKMSRSTDGNA